VTIEDSQKIKALFFDYDGVLTTDKTGSISTCRYISQRTNIELSQVADAFRVHNGDLTIGKRSYADAWPEICSRLGQDIPLKLLVEAFDSTPVNAEMLALARVLANRYVVGIVTDNKMERIERVRRTQCLDDVFKPIVVSAEVGCTKEDRRIFRVALARANVSAEEAVFIDNSRANLIAAADVGIRTIYFDDETNDVPALRRCLEERYGVSVQSDA
jgi:putative hydrolase of the HAD superfamily